jgi:DNA-binding NtrC family response regulator
VSERPSLLIVDDEAAILETLRILFKNEGFEVSVAQGGPAALEALERWTPEIVLTDVRMPLVNGIDILAAVKQRDADLPVVLMTAQAELKTAIEGINQGAFHYIQKPFDNDELVSICRRALEHRKLKTENRVLKQEIQRRERTQVVKPIGVSKPFRDVMRMVETVAPTDSTVLIQGESGTGKEVIARYIHALSAT